MRTIFLITDFNDIDFEIDNKAFETYDAAAQYLKNKIADFFLDSIWDARTENSLGDYFLQYFKKGISLADGYGNEIDNLPSFEDFREKHGSYLEFRIDENSFFSLSEIDLE